jgi:hypothetical protein
MANKKISELSEATNLNNGDLIAIVQDGETKKISKENLSASIGFSISKVIYLDSINSGGIVYNNLSDAKEAADDETLIIVNPGVWINDNLCKIGERVNYYFYPNSGVDLTDDYISFIADDEASEIYIYGNGTFKQTGLAGPPVIYMENEYSILHIEADSMDINFCAISCSYYINCKEINYKGDVTTNGLITAGGLATGLKGVLSGRVNVTKENFSDTLLNNGGSPYAERIFKDLEINVLDSDDGVVFAFGSGNNKVCFSNVTVKNQNGISIIHGGSGNIDLELQGVNYFDTAISYDDSSVFDFIGGGFLKVENEIIYPDITSGYATETYVDDAIADIDLSTYATEEYVDDAIADISLDIIALPNQDPAPSAPAGGNKLYSNSSSNFVVINSNGYKATADVNGLAADASFALLSSGNISGLKRPINFTIEGPTNKTYPLIASADITNTLTDIKGLKTTSGTCTIAIHINGVAVTFTGGGTTINVNNIGQDINITSGGSVTIGHEISIVVTSAAAPVDLRGVIIR